MNPRESNPNRQAQPSSTDVEALIALYNKGLYVESENRALALTSRFPHFGFGWKLLSIAQHMQGKDPLPALQRAVQLLPGDASVHNNLGNVLQHLGQFEEAAASYRHALRLKPDISLSHYNLGNVLQALGRPEDAVASYRKAIQIEPDFAEAHNNMGNALQTLCKQNDALASYRRALELNPGFSVTHSNLLFVNAYHAMVGPHEYLLLARNWERDSLTDKDRREAQHREFKVVPLKGRRLKVGYVSGDYRQHAVSFFIEKLFSHHDRTRIELFAFSANSMQDVVTDRLRALVDHWVPIAETPDATVRDQIETHGIDVLIDLSGHTQHNRMGVFSRRAAPVQAHYLGYIGSTGLTEMDYWIGDEILTPDETDSHFSERVWRLPRVWVCYEGKADAPLPAWRPDRDNTIWLGSFNNLGKLTPATLALWAKVLHALPEGKFLLKHKELAIENNRRRIVDAMVQHGIPPDRIELRDSSVTPNWHEHMAYYGRLDIALDPVGPVGGGTTTCDALWMGVPVVALAGDRMASRMTASMLDAIGHPEWIARSESEYIDMAVSLGRDVELRKTLRAGQRDRMAASPLCNAQDLAKSLEDAYLEMYARWQKR